jgi:hypothetical protein
MKTVLYYYRTVFLLIFLPEFWAMDSGLSYFASIHLKGSTCNRFIPSSFLNIGSYRIRPF